MTTRRVYLLMLLITVVALGGCVEITHSVAVDTDGQIDRLEFEMDMDPTVYSLLRSESDTDFSSEEAFREDVLEGLGEGELDYESANATIDDSGSRVVMSIVIEGVDPSTMENITVTEENGQMHFVDHGTYNTPDTDDSDDEDQIINQSEIYDQISYEYVLTMPGEIIDSTADEVEGDTARWDLMDSPDEPRIEATSEIDEPGAIPGFGAIAAGLALLITILAFMVTRRLR